MKRSHYQIKTMKTPLQTVREAVIAAVPEILELKFGSHIETKDFHWRIICEGKTYPQFKQWIAWDGTNVQMVWESEITMTHGRPIRLADVLRTIMVMKNNKRGTGKYAPSYLTILPELITSWDLTKDDLSLQSEETLKFLAELLTN